jgi:hypothetical protein
MSYDIAAIVLIFSLSGLLIYYYGQVVQIYWNGQDILKATIVPDTDIDCWSIAHLILFTMLGYLFPQWIPVFIVIGVIWEAIENATGDPEIRKQAFGDFKENKYWYSKISDIVIDIYALMLGFTLSLILP